LHDPIRALRQADGTHAARDQYLHAMQMLFNLQAELPKEPGENEPRAGV
jgi:hypothetical protein